MCHFESEAAWKLQIKSTTPDITPGNEKGWQTERMPLDVVCSPADSELLHPRTC